MAPPSTLTQAVKIDHFGGPEVMELASMELPPPTAQQVQVRMVCAGVNPADWKCRAGQLVGQPNYTPRFPMVLGFDGAGVVWQTGSAVQGLRKGDRVMVWASLRADGWGTYAEYANVDAEAVARIPDSMGFEEAASVPIAGMTVWQDLFYPDRGALQDGQSLFLHGGSGGMGSFGVQFARARGVRVAASCSAANSGYVASLGAERVFDYRQQDLLKCVRGWMPQGVDVVLDCVGMGSLPGALSMLRPGGILVRVATLGPADLEGPTAADAQRQGVRAILARRARTGTEGELAQIIALMATGKVQAPPIRVFPLAEVAEAHRLVAEGHVRGKLILRVADPAVFAQAA